MDEDARRVDEIRSTFDFHRGLETIEITDLFDYIDALRDERDALRTRVRQLTDQRDELLRLAAIGREIEYEVERHGDPYLMGVLARVAAGDGFTQNEGAP